MTDFNTALNDFIAAVNEGFNKQNASMAVNFPDGYHKPVTLEAGSKYIRVVSNSNNHRSVYCFVEKVTGNILKAASWKSPAKGARANIFTPDSYTLARVECYTGWLYAR